MGHSTGMGSCLLAAVEISHGASATLLVHDRPQVCLSLKPAMRGGRCSAHATRSLRGNRSRSLGRDCLTDSGPNAAINGRDCL